MSQKKKNSTPRATASELSGAQILDALKRGHKPLRLDELLRVMNLPRKAKKHLEIELATLMEAGTILRITGGGYTLAGQLKQLSGVLHMQRSGVGFVLPDGAKGDAAKGDDIFIAPHQMQNAWHGDRVMVALLPGTRGKNREGRIVSVLERGTKELPARALRLTDDGVWLCEPADPRLAATFLVTTAGLPAQPVRDDLLLIRPGELKGPGLWDAEALSNLGSEESVSAQELVVKAAHAVPVLFPANVLAEAAALPKEPDLQDMEGRRDCSDLGFVTIDGATAKDFDDAVYVEKEGSAFRLRVAIADVAHYVRPGSPLDREALVRGNSYYFPSSVEPMLPEALSNGLCSLNPQVPRLVMVAEMVFSANGQPGAATFYPGLIRSKARLTYDQVFQGVVQKDAAQRETLRPVLPMLETAEELARILARARDARGSLDFDLPEPEFRFDATGRITAIVPQEHNFAHRLIEEFMVAANEAVARFLTAKGLPLLYRAHPAPDPDKLKNLFVLLSRSSLTAELPQSPSLKDLQALLLRSKGTDQEYVVNRLTLRTMMQAAYTPEHEGHFGLASECYCHFTSPIRRYADLVVHRSLKAALKAPDAAPLPPLPQFQSVADQINTTERTALDAEREIQRRLGVLFVQDKVGQHFTGTISGVTEFGFFVELREVMAEGMVRLASMRDDYYVLFQDRQELRGERTGRTLRLGQQVGVVLTDVSLARQEVTFELDDPAYPKGRTRKELPAGGNAEKPAGKGKPRGAGKGAGRGKAGAKNASAKRPKGSTSGKRRAAR